MDCTECTDGRAFFDIHIVVWVGAHAMMMIFDLTDSIGCRGVQVVVMVMIMVMVIMVMMIVVIMIMVMMIVVMMTTGIMMLSVISHHQSSMCIGIKAQKLYWHKCINLCIYIGINA